MTATLVSRKAQPSADWSASAAQPVRGRLRLAAKGSRQNKMPTFRASVGA